MIHLKLNILPHKGNIFALQGNINFISSNSELFSQEIWDCIPSLAEVAHQAEILEEN